MLSKVRRKMPGGFAEVTLAGSVTRFGLAS
jgi:hypothetical protein